MLRKMLLWAIAFVCTGFALLAQKTVVDVVYLKNGSIIRGIILEQIPSKSLKLQTADGSIWVYQVDEVERITRDFGTKIHTRPSRSNYKQPVEAPTTLTTRPDKQPIEHQTYIGLSLGMPTTLKSIKLGVGLDLLDFGHLFTPNVGIGARLGGSMWFFDYTLPEYGVLGLETSDREQIGTAGYGSLMVGPLFRLGTPNSKGGIGVEIRPLLGIIMPYLAFNGKTYTDKIQFACSFDAMTLIPLNKNFALRAGLELYARPITVLSPKFGVAWRL